MPSRRPVTPAGFTVRVTAGRSAAKTTSAPSSVRAASVGPPARATRARPRPTATAADRSMPPVSVAPARGQAERVRFSPPRAIIAAVRWWQTAVVYQIYPRSFADATGDGVGDLEGLRRRLDHLAWLGVDAVWLSPIFPSPMKDFGYDVADYCDVDPLFGSLDDLDRLLAEAHARGIRVLLDWVPNHTSDQHPWFRASRASRER